SARTKDRAAGPVATTAATGHPAVTSPDGTGLAGIGATGTARTAAGPVTAVDRARAGPASAARTTPGADAPPGGPAGRRVRRRRAGCPVSLRWAPLVATGPRPAGSRWPDRPAPAPR